MHAKSLQFSSVQSLSRVRLFATPWIAARQASLSITNSRSSLKLTSIESVMPSSHLILCPLFHTVPSWSHWPKLQTSSPFSSVAQSCWTLCDPMDCSTPGFPVHHQLLELPQTWINDAIQPSHPLSSPYPPAFSLSQHQGLFKWVQFFASGGQRIGVSASASVLPNEQSGLISFRMDWLDPLAVQGTLKSLL